MSTAGEPGWQPVAIVRAVRRHLGAGKMFEYAHLVDRVHLVGGDVRVVLRGAGRHGGDDLLGVRYSLARIPYGPSTGEVCPSVDAWAVEIAWDLDEAIGTREIDSAERLVEPDGVVLLRWWRGGGWSQ